MYSKSIYILTENNVNGNVVKMYFCIKCGGPLEYNYHWHQWYCRNCIQDLNRVLSKKQNQNSEIKGSFLNVIKGVLLIFCVVIISLFITGLLQIQIGLDDTYNFNFNEINSVPLSVKGFVNISITLVFFFSLNIFLNNTLRNKKWWQKLIRTFDLDAESHNNIFKFKGNATEIFIIFNGSIVLVGLIMITIGLIFLNIVDTIIFNMVSCVIIFLGIFPIFWGYGRYQSDVENFTQLIAPSLSDKSQRDR